MAEIHRCRKRCPLQLHAIDVNIQFFLGGKIKLLEATCVIRLTLCSILRHESSAVLIDEKLLLNLGDVMPRAQGCITVPEHFLVQ